MRWWALVAVVGFSGVSEARRLAQKPSEPPHHPSLTWVEDEPVSGRVMTEVLEDPMFVEPLAELTDVEAARVVRAHLAEVNGCYRVEARRLMLAGGKATLSLEIDGEGAVTGSALVAPTLTESNVPACIKASAQRWSFPRSLSKKRFSYPIVFIDG